MINLSLPGRFYTKLFYTLFLRMKTIYYEPVNLVYLFYKIDWKIRYNNVILNLIVLILIFGKDGYFIVGLTILSKFITFYLLKSFIKR